MKRGTVLSLALAIALMILFAAGCSLSGPEVSIEQRIDDFESDLKKDNWESLYEHIHPDNGKRSAARDRSYWESVLDGPDYNFTNVSNSGDNRDVTVENVYDSQHPSPDTWRFKMKEDKDGPLARSSWYINGITSENGIDPLP
jgi:hypothetical protein